mmetsp:Transcript_27263/g.70681  ORF Transcript_27263/g.70681 Transcript_27263/m.70681 type:complete len:320 (+) Transcript_27263:438-1397(+)
MARAAPHPSSPGGGDITGRRWGMVTKAENPTPTGASLLFGPPRWPSGAMVCRLRGSQGTPRSAPPSTAWSRAVFRSIPDCGASACGRFSWASTEVEFPACIVLCLLFRRTAVAPGSGEPASPTDWDRVERRGPWPPGRRVSASARGDLGASVSWSAHLCRRVPGMDSASARGVVRVCCGLGSAMSLLAPEASAAAARASRDLLVLATTCESEVSPPPWPPNAPCRSGTSDAGPPAAPSLPQVVTTPGTSGRSWRPASGSQASSPVPSVAVAGPGTAVACSPSPGPTAALRTTAGSTPGALESCFAASSSSLRLRARPSV